jgi:hypothetical protein
MRLARVGAAAAVVKPLSVERLSCKVNIVQIGCEDGLLEALDRGPVPAEHVVIAGCEAHVCLMQTGLGLLRSQRRLWVVESACGSRRASDHRLAMRRLGNAGAERVSHEMVHFEWLRDCRHPQFKTVLRLIKDMPLDDVSALPDAPQV